MKTFSVIPEDLGPPTHPAAGPQPPACGRGCGQAGRAAPRSSGCCSACGAEVGLVLVWFLWFGFFFFPQLSSCPQELG